MHKGFVNLSIPDKTLWTVRLIKGVVVQPDKANDEHNPSKKRQKQNGYSNLLV